jgi:hypothetical protein
MSGSTAVAIDWDISNMALTVPYGMSLKRSFFPIHATVLSNTSFSRFYVQSGSVMSVFLLSAGLLGFFPSWPNVLGILIFPGIQAVINQSDSSHFLLHSQMMFGLNSFGANFPSLARQIKQPGPECLIA